jgi:hypothetical protein
MEDLASASAAGFSSFFLPLNILVGSECYYEPAVPTNVEEAAGFFSSTSNKRAIHAARRHHKEMKMVELGTQLSLAAIAAQTACSRGSRSEGRQRCLRSQGFSEE